MRRGGLSATRVLVRFQALGLALSLGASAFLLAISVASHGPVWLAWISLLPLFLAIRVLSPARALVAGGLWGLCFYSFALAAGMRSFPPGVGALALVVGVAALYAGLGALATRALGFFPWVLGLLWILVEVALKPLGFHNGLLAGTQGDGGLVHWLGGALGYASVAFLMAYTNVWLLALLARPRRTAWPAHSLARQLRPAGYVVPRSSRLAEVWVPCRSYSRAPPAR